MSDKVLLTVKEVAALLHTNVNYVYRLINAGILPALKLGSFKVRKEVLLKFIEDNEGKDLADPKNVRSFIK